MKNRKYKKELIKWYRKMLGRHKNMSPYNINYENLILIKKWLKTNKQLRHSNNIYYIAKLKARTTHLSYYIKTRD